jgi:hypothetical protein
VLHGIQRTSSRPNGLRNSEELSQHSSSSVTRSPSRNFTMQPVTNILKSDLQRHATVQVVKERVPSTNDLQRQSSAPMVISRTVQEQISSRVANLDGESLLSNRSQAQDGDGPLKRGPSKPIRIGTDTSSLLGRNHHPSANDTDSTLINRPQATDNRSVLSHHRQPAENDSTPSTRQLYTDSNDSIRLNRNGSKVNESALAQRQQSRAEVETLEILQRQDNDPTPVPRFSVPPCKMR